MAIENLSELETKLKLKEGTLQAALDNDEGVSVDVPELVIMTTEEDEKRLTNIKAESKKAGLEIAIKTVRNDLGLEFEGKTMENLLTSHKEHILKDASKAPNDKIAELENDKKALSSNLQAVTGDFDAFKQTVDLERKQGDRNSAITGIIGDNTILPKDRMLTLFNTDIQSEHDDKGRLIHKKNGETLKNSTTLDPLSTKEVFDNWATENSFFKKPSGGAGEGDNTGNSKAGSLAAFTEEMKGKDITPGSIGFNEEMNKRITDGTLKV